MTQQITIVVPIKAKTEKRAEVRRRLQDLAAQTHREPGNINYILHEVPSQPDLFLIYENWKDQAALDFHMEQDYLKQFLADWPLLLTEEVRGTICRLMEDDVK